MKSCGKKIQTSLILQPPGGRPGEYPEREPYPDDRADRWRDYDRREPPYEDRYDDRFLDRDPYGRDPYRR